MKKDKTIHFPHSIKNVSIKVVLVEKAKLVLNGVNFCCFLNDVSVYTDFYLDKERVQISSKQEFDKSIHYKIQFIVTGYEPEQIQTDSTTLQYLVDKICWYNRKSI